MKLKKVKKAAAKDPEQQWSVIFKLECYGKMPMSAIDRQDASNNFLLLPKEELIAVCEVFKPQVMGILKKAR